MPLISDSDFGEPDSAIDLLSASLEFQQSVCKGIVWVVFVVVFI